MLGQRGVERSWSTTAARKKEPPWAYWTDFGWTGSVSSSAAAAAGSGEKWRSRSPTRERDVALTGRDVASLERTANDIRALGRQAWPMQADMSAPDACAAACERALAEHGPFDILVNNVGGRRDPTPIRDMPVERWRELVDLNLTSAFVCTKVIGGAMVDRGEGGRVINIASINAFVAGQEHWRPPPRGGQGRRRPADPRHGGRLGAYGVTVNAICPGVFMTEPNLRWARERPEVIDGIKERTPMASFGQPEDLGPLAVYLASDARAS